MAKTNRIKLEVEGASFVLGLASLERSWKLCWEVNQALDLQLSSDNPELHLPTAEPVFADAETDPDFEYLLMENTGRGAKVPRAAQPFRYWLIIKPRRQKEPDLAALINRLKAAPAVTLVMDLTPFNLEKPFLP